MRMRGHAIHDPADYVPSELLQQWENRDPIITFSKSLRDSAILDFDAETAMDARVYRAVKEGVAWAESSPMPDGNTLTDGVYA
jgi:pyruvate dehydrogenase E1 component alpha subunit